MAKITHADVGNELTKAEWQAEATHLADGVPGAEMALISDLAGAGGGIQIAVAGGTVDAITATYSPALTLTDLVMCAFVSSGANTITTPTFAPDGLTPHTITKYGGQALSAGDIGDALVVCILEYNLANTRWELVNPKGPKGDQGIPGVMPGCLLLTAQGGWPRATNGCGPTIKTEVGTADYFSLDFDKTDDEYAQWMLVMPLDWDAGTITARFYWTFTDGSPGQTVKWYIAGRSYADSDAFNQARGTAIGTEDTALTAADVHISEASAAVTIAGATAGELLLFEVYRDVSEDTLDGDAKLLGIMVTFTRS